MESRRAPEERIIFDPLAETLAGTAMKHAAHGEHTLEHMQGQPKPQPLAPAEAAEEKSVDSLSEAALAASLRTRLACRTRFLDDWFQRLADAAPSRDALKQTVIMGAGMDSRAFRLPCFSSATRVFELDQPSVLRLKERLLQDAAAKGIAATPLAKRTTVECNFSVPPPKDIKPAVDAAASQAANHPSGSSSSSTVDQHWTVSLAAAGFDRTQPSCWMMEGLLMYLSEEQQLQLIQFVSELAVSGSQMALTHIAQHSLKYAEHVTKVRSDSKQQDPHALPPVYLRTLAQMTSCLSPGLLAALDRHGWRIVTLTHIGARDCSYGVMEVEHVPAKVAEEEGHWNEALIERILIAEKK